MAVRWASPDERQDSALLCIGLVFLLSCLFAAYLVGQAGRYAASDQPGRVETEVRCWEDQPCASLTDCREAGNRVCGPVQP